MARIDIDQLLTFRSGPVGFKEYGSDWFRCDIVYNYHEGKLSGNGCAAVVIDDMLEDIPTALLQRRWWRQWWRQRWRCSHVVVGDVAGSDLTGINHKITFLVRRIQDGRCITGKAYLDNLISMACIDID